MPARGDPVAMTGYLGGDGASGRSIADSPERYDDQNEKDYDNFVKADPIRAPRSG